MRNKTAASASNAVRLTWHIERRAIAELRPHPRNPRAFTKKGLDDLGESLDSFGLAEPIVINTDGLVIGGHARLHVLRERGEMFADCNVPDRTLSSSECDELLIRLNANIAGEWDWDGLANEWDASLLVDWGLEIKAAREGNFDESDFSYLRQYDVIVSAESEQEQREIYDRLVALGYSPKVVAT